MIKSVIEKLNLIIPIFTCKISRALREILSLERKFKSKENTLLFNNSSANTQEKENAQMSNILNKKVAKARNFFKGISISKIKADVLQNVADNQSMLEKSMNNV